VQGFLSVDPLAADFASWSPYNYVLGNPVIFIDPDGREPYFSGTSSKFGSEEEQEEDEGYWFNGNNSTESGASYDDNNNGGGPGLSIEGFEARTAIGQSLLFAGGAREYYRSEVYKLLAKYGDDFKGGSLARTKIKGFVRARMTPFHFKVALDYFRPNKDIFHPINKPTPRYWHSNKLVNGLGRLSLGLGLASFGVDIVGLYNYNFDPNASLITTPDNFILNTITTASATFGGPIGLGIATGVTISRVLNPDGKNEPIPFNPNSCFVAGTKILMTDGSQKNIENILVGDKILSTNMDNMLIEEDEVIRFPVTIEFYRKIIIKFSNGIDIKCSPQHPIYVKGKGWSVIDVKMAEKDISFDLATIEEGDIVFYYEKGILKEIKIEKIIDSGNYEKMYNVKYVKKNNTFFANGILVHNRFNN